MSASLVGSEMCIRDSPETPQNPAELGGTQHGMFAHAKQKQQRVDPAGTCLLYTSDAADDMQ
eukprot:2215689-Alexandrium_andersonii.AAC.1